MKRIRPTLRLLTISLTVGGVLYTGQAIAMPTIGTVTPAADTGVNDTFNVSAVVNAGGYVLTGVTATVGSSTIALTKTNAVTWTKAINISAEPLGPVTLVIAATDANGDTAVKNVPLKHSHPPTLTVLTPGCDVGNPNVRLHATCADADPYGCASITAFGASTTSAELDQTIDLSAYTGRGVDVTFTATDAVGLSTSQKIRLFGPPSSTTPSVNLSFVDQVVGRVLDADATRILYVDCGGVQVKSRFDGSITTLGSETISTVVDGRLSSVGAIWTGGDSVNGVSSSRANTGFRARGDWAVWADNAVSPTKAFRQNLTTGVVSQMVQNTAARNVFGWPDVDSAGNASYGTLGNNDLTLAIWTLSAAGVLTYALNDGRDGIIDGTNIVYRDSRNSVTRLPIRLKTASSTIVLDPEQTQGTTPPSSYKDYWARGGWVAYTKYVDLTNNEIWTRSPSGTHRLASPLYAKQLDGLNASGEVVVRSGTQRYISAASPGGPTAELPIGPALGRMVDVGTDWYEVEDRSVYKVAAGGGVVDAGADGSEDAGYDAGGGEDDAGYDAGGSEEDAGGGEEDAGGGVEDGGSSSGGSSSGGSSSGGSSSGGSGSGSSSGGSSSGGSSSGSESPDDVGGCASAPGGSDVSSSFGTMVLSAMSAFFIKRRRRRAPRTDFRAP